MSKRVLLSALPSLLRGTGLAAFLFATLGMNQALAQTASSERQDQWHYTGAAYIWGTDIGGRTISGSEVEVEFSDVVDSLEMAFMGAFSARKNEWSILSDVIYFNLGADEAAELSIPVGPIQVPVTTGTSLDMEGWILHVGGGYELYSARDHRLDLVGGVRYLDLEMDLFLALESLGSGQSRTVSESLTALDAMVGLKGRASLGGRWSLPYYLDIGAGESEFTWQAALGVAFQAGDSWDVALLYRHLDWDLDSTRVIDDMSFSGPTLGAVFRW